MTEGVENARCSFNDYKCEINLLLFGSFIS